MTDAPLVWWTATASDLPSDDGWLAPEERAVLAKLRVPKRAADFVLGRFTAKHVVAEAVAALGLGPAGIGALSIVPRSDGSPEAHLDGQPLPIDVSLSHAAGRALAVVTIDGSERIGCDVEHVERRGPELARDFFTHGEQAALAALSGEALDAATTLVWSAKESTLKVLREGLRADTRSVEVELGAVLDATWCPLATRTEGRTYAGAAARHGAYVFTVSTSGAPPAERLVALRPGYLGSSG